MKIISPNITSRGIIVFEVPHKGKYYLHVSGGFWDDKYAPILLKKNWYLYTMQRLCLLLLAIFTLSTANAIKKWTSILKRWRKLVGTADRNKMGEILEKSRIMDDGREVFEGFNAYDKMFMAYYCIFDDKGVLKSVVFPTKYATWYALEMIMVNKINTSVNFNRKF